MADEKYSHRRELKFSRSSRNKTAVSSNILDSTPPFSGGEPAEGVRNSTRMKILVRKEDLKRVLEAIRSSDDRGGGTAARAASSLEQRLNWMRRRQILRAARGRSGISWRPVLQSIPEEM